MSKATLLSRLGTLKQPTTRLLAFGLPVAVSVGFAAWLLRTTKEAPKHERRERTRTLRVIEANELPFVPQASGFGVAKADSSWRAIARVSGRISEVRPELRPGSPVEEGALVLRIEDTDVAMDVAVSKAEVARLKASIATADVEAANQRRSLEVAKEALAVAEQEFQRIRDLVIKDASSAAESEQSQRTLLAERQSVIDLENSLALVPTKRANLLAQLDAARAGLAKRERDLQFCEVRAPFTGTVGPVALEAGQYVASGEVLFEVYSDARLRVDAAIPQDHLYRLLDESTRKLITERMSNPSGEVRDLFSARVVVADRGTEVAWPANVVGARESLDANTRALRVTVVVEQGPLNLVDSSKLPLSRGAFCRVELAGRERTAVVIPRHAVRNGAVLTLDTANRLRQRAVHVAFSQGGLAVLREGLPSGTRVVVSDPGPTMEGALVVAVIDEDLTKELAHESAGGGAR
ncbi:MAG: HlyD family efflux transporter periplasmic adaptor subunit [Planctomycetota bacterium]